MDTIMAPLTAVLTSPVITLRVSGDVKGVLKFFNIENMLPRTATRAKYKSVYDDKIQDDVLIIYYKAPASYTGEDVLEISFHGNPIIINAAMQDFASEGVRLAERGEFSRRAYLNHKLSLSQAESIEAMIHAQTAEGVASSHRLLHGELDGRFQNIRNMLLEELAEIEAGIDFAEEIENEYSENTQDKFISSRRELLSLIGSYDSNRLAINGVNIAIVGAPNAGKSTLFNKLLGTERAIVSSEAGTTRDVLTEAAHAESIRYSLTDTAGLRKTESIAEGEGVKRARERIDHSDYIIFAFDLSAEDTDEVAELMVLAKKKGWLKVGTKRDKVNQGNPDADICISCVSDEGIDELKQLINTKVKELTACTGETGLISERQLFEARQALMEIETVLNSHYLTVDLTAYHIKKAVECLDRIKGAGVTEETLDIIFSKFCIGK